MESGKHRVAEDALAGSKATFNNTFNLNSLPVHDVSGLTSKYKILDFNIPASPTHYTNLSKSFLYLRLKVTDSDDKPHAGESKT